LFSGEKGNPKRVRDGYLWSTSLAKVSVVLYLLQTRDLPAFWTFGIVFTSPSSVAGELDATRGPTPKKKGTSTNGIL